MASDNEFQDFVDGINSIIGLVNAGSISEAKTSMLTWAGQFLARADLFQHNMLLMYRMATVGAILGHPEVPQRLATMYRTSSRDLNDVHLFLASRGPGTMVDVGAQWGTVCAPYLWQGWRALAFEPDPGSQDRMRDVFSNVFRFTLDARAVSDVEETHVPFYTGDTTNVRSLHGGHEAGGGDETTSREVDVTTLESAFKTHAVKNVMYLKVDVEGHERKVLNGIPWDTVRPQVIVAEFDNDLPGDLGCSAADITDLLAEKGYHTVCSEWDPIIQYGTSHNWSRYTRDIDSVNPAAWGNIIAFDRESDYRAFADEFMAA